MRTRVFVLLVAAVSTVALVITPGAGAQGQQIKPCDGDGQIHATPKSFWPPNHRLHTVNLAFTLQEFDGDTTKIEVLSITNNEQGLEKGKMLADNPDDTGVGNSGTGVDESPDAPFATTSVQVRAERMGHHKAGRTYDITVRCTDEGNVSGTGPRVDTVTMNVNVPHNR